MSLQPKYSERGGGKASGFADDFIGMLSGLLGGQAGASSAGAQFSAANPQGSTGGVMEALQGLLSGTGAQHGAINTMISKQGDRDVAGLRARFGAGGGTAFGTGAQYGEGVMRAETAPKMAMAHGQLQLSALSQLMPILAGITQKGTTQRQGIMQPSGLSSAISTIAPLASAAANIFAPGIGGAITGKAFDIFNPPVPQMGGTGGIPLPDPTTLASLWGG